VNQKLALKQGFCPCSTIKIITSFAALSEGLVERTTRLPLSRRVSMDMTEALALSNNPYFAKLGNQLGFRKVAYYARLFGLGEKAGLDIPGEEPGFFPSTPPKEYSVGLMTSFGTGIQLTALQLASMMSVIANGGTMYFLQYPQSQKDVERFVPRVKRHLDIQPFIAEVKPGMLGAVEYGTAKRAAYDPNEPVFGKTGTCSEYSGPTAHLGWFGAFNDTGKSKLVVAVLLTGGRIVNGPLASSVAGQLYKNLAQSQYWAKSQGYSPAALAGTPTCCAQ
jgi:cell division protein FtsI/penicillin-binding protein 2